MWIVSGPAPAWPGLYDSIDGAIDEVERRTAVMVEDRPAMAAALEKDGTAQFEVPAKVARDGIAGLVAIHRAQVNHPE